ncbi:MAG: tetratricopeptide repeat protein [Nitrospina sp.]|nr:tetratricopeptide repeat protein [Nitrospina sp.]
MAKTEKLRRKDLIQPDQFISTTDILIAYFSKHKTIVTSIVISLIVVVFFGLWFKSNQNKKSLSMESLYFKLEQTILVNDNNKIKKMEILLDQFSEGAQKQRAFLLLAGEYFNKGSYDKAIEYYQNILDRSSSPLNQQLANVGIAYSFEGQKDYKNAINAYKNTIKHAFEYPLFDVYVGLARCYELNNEKNEALLILREMQTRFSNNLKIDSVNNKINELTQ